MAAIALSWFMVMRARKARISSESETILNLFAL